MILKIKIPLRQVKPADKGFEPWGTSNMALVYFYQFIPLAHGYLIFLQGDEIKNLDSYYV